MNKLSISSFALATTMLFTGVAHADDNKRIVQLQAEVSRQIANDEMQAVLYTELNEKDASTLANRINQILNQSIAVAKQYPQVQIRTGSQNTYPIYNDKRQLTNWRGRAEIVLSGANFKANSELIAKLQQNLQLQDINFSVSKAQREKVENELYVEASKAFQKRAQLLLAPWNAQRYELVNLQFSSDNNYYPRPMAMMAGAEMKQHDIQSQNIEAGNSEVKVVASGSVQLQ
ncbi:SIMPL domain-containing protein [Acinetobacter sp. c3-l95]|uniref:SIMPL domain-containing protein n=1 Tax=Acinetobacter sp. c3-l95 TaxID=3342804 RepID=UPI0035B9DDE6